MNRISTCRKTSLTCTPAPTRLTRRSTLPTKALTSPRSKHVASGKSNQSIIIQQEVLAFTAGRVDSGTWSTWCSERNDNRVWSLQCTHSMRARNTAVWNTAEASLHSRDPAACPCRQPPFVMKATTDRRGRRASALLRTHTSPIQSRHDSADYPLTSSCIAETRQLPI